jgi:predicted PurR-regulated permease PerM
MKAPVDDERQADAGAPRRQLDLPAATIVKILLLAAAIWALIKLATLIAVVLVAVVLAIACEPAVAWLERRRVPRWLAAILTVGALAAVLVIFFASFGSSLVAQGRDVVERLLAFRQTLANALARVVRGSGTVTSDAVTIAGYAVEAGRIIAAGLVGALVVSILTLYLLIEGGRTWAWLVAYVPARNRGRVRQTADAGRAAVRHYVAANVATSIFAGVVVLGALTALKVPAALLLASLAAICDFVPILGFIASAVPAVLLALTVSTPTALGVGAAYAACHAVENYLIAPKVYGERLRLSTLLCCSRLPSARSSLASSARSWRFPSRRCIRASKTSGCAITSRATPLRDTGESSDRIGRITEVMAVNESRAEFAERRGEERTGPQRFAWAGLRPARRWS